jgi:uncharacterized protein YdaL
VKRTVGVFARWLLAFVVSAGVVFSAQALVSPLPGSIVTLTLPNLAEHPWPGCASGAPRAESVERRRILLLRDQDAEGTGGPPIQAALMANLASHFGKVQIAEVRNYRSGEMLDYDALIYLGSSYREQLSEAFRRDVDSGERPVLWLKENIDQLKDPASFQRRYGWLWKSFEGPGDFTLAYKNALLRPSGEGVGLTTFAALDRKRVRTLATATVRGREPIPWAVSSRHLTYVGDIPLGTTSTADASLALADLLHDVVPDHDPVVPDRHRALVRIEDIGPMSNPDDLRAIAAALKTEGIPYSIAVYPLYVGPIVNGRQRTVHLAERPQVVRAIVEMIDGGASLVLHGYSHQLGDRKNPRSGESGTDYEFFAAHLDDEGNVVYDGPVPGDSQAWAQERIDKSLAELADLGLPRPTMFNVPHYAASPADYAAIGRTFAARYDRPVLLSGVGRNAAGISLHLRTGDPVLGQGQLREPRRPREPRLYRRSVGERLRAQHPERRAGRSDRPADGPGLGRELLLPSVLGQHSAVGPRPRAEVHGLHLHLAVRAVTHERDLQPHPGVRRVLDAAPRLVRFTFPGLCPGPGGVGRLA